MKRDTKLELNEWELLHLKIEKMIVSRILGSIGEKRVFWENKLKEFKEQAERIEKNIVRVLEN